MRISVKAWMAEAGFDNMTDALEEHGYDSVCPAMCSEGCEVEPDGRCEHGAPSLLLAMGLI